MQKKQEDRPAVDSDTQRQATEDATYQRRCLWGRRGRESLSEREDGDAEAHVTDDELLSDWKAERTAFGLLLVGYAFLMSMAPILARYPNETAQMACTSIRHIVDWRVWVVSASAMCLAAVAAIVLKRRR